MLKRRPMWDVAKADETGNELASLLDAGWQPFAVTQKEGDDSATIWLRRQVRLGSKKPGLAARP